MKRFTWALFSVTVFTAVAGCCTKKGCLSGEINRVDAYGYTPEELSYITVSSYEKGSSFSVLLDSSQTYQQEQEEDHYIVAALIMADRDYKLKVVATGDEFLLSDIVTETDKCDINGGPLCDYDIVKVTSYRLNGTQTQYDGVAVKITKP